MVDGATVDAETTTFGIRTVAVDPARGFLLERRAAQAEGRLRASRQRRAGCGVVSTAPKSARSRFTRRRGYNAIRCAHNPPAPAFLDACDRLGMLVIDEAFDCWRVGKNAGDYHVAFDAWQERDIASMVRRDRNHPSVVMWSIGNEVVERDGRSEGGAIARMLADEVRALDPTRPITAAICGTFDEQAHVGGHRRGLRPAGRGRLQLPVGALRGGSRAASRTG